MICGMSDYILSKGGVTQRAHENTKAETNHRDHSRNQQQRHHPHNTRAESKTGENVKTESGVKCQLHKHT